MYVICVQGRGQHLTVWWSRNQQVSVAVVRVQLGPS